MMYVSFEVRIKLADEAGDCAMLVRGNEFRRSRGKRRLLIPFGGGLKATESDMRNAAFKEAIGDITPGMDLRFDANDEQLAAVKQFAAKLTSRRILSEAMREFSEEMVVERRFLPQLDVDACLYSFESVEVFEGQSERHSNQGEPTLYVVGIVNVEPPYDVLDKLITISEPRGSHLEFVTPSILKDGGTTEKGSIVMSTYSYLA